MHTMAQAGFSAGFQMSLRNWLLLTTLLSEGDPCLTGTFRELCRG